MTSSRLIGLSVHLFTASGAALGLIALFLAADGRFAAMFAWLGAALVVDAVDGTLARRFRVTETAPFIDGVALDLVVDFLNYVVTPLVALWRSGLLDPALAAPVCAAVCAGSALYFADRRMKTADYWFRGFPSLWNIVVFYLLVLRPTAAASLTLVLVTAAFMFVPVAFVHPLRVQRRRPITLVVTGVWGAAAIAALAQNLAAASFTVKAALVMTGCYFLALPLFREGGAIAKGEDDG
ncbi:phosphatidylcholine/phosphatidylserine synthase [Methylocystis sp. SC2]|uniref:CDP-alcohol phosphatidyltransferase family protein n=1 Tax=Methylocystis sp. (strain SC2) TaxID=187303 RepID=UPI00027AF45F|nr:phosphatidylcholine synthase [Methylocystis sp. SC2]CCJ06029.1 Phosphatidylcholine synthase protein [Methylocystis sp. SC2]